MPLLKDEGEIVRVRPLYASACGHFTVAVTLVELAEIPAECGLIEAGFATAAEWKRLVQHQAGFFHFDPGAGTYCVMTIPAPWRDTPGPTWQLLAAMLRHQRRAFEEKPPAPPAQQRLALE